MTNVNVGPAIVKIPEEEQKELNTSFRIIADYLPGTDKIIARIDVLIGGEPAVAGMKIGSKSGKQFNITLQSTDVSKSCLPNPSCVEASASVQVNGKELIEKLRALADRLEKELS